MNWFDELHFVQILKRTHEQAAMTEAWKRSALERSSELNTMYPWINLWMYPPLCIYGGIYHMHVHGLICGSIFPYVPMDVSVVCSYINTCTLQPQPAAVPTVLYYDSILYGLCNESSVYIKITKWFWIFKD